MKKPVVFHPSEASRRLERDHLLSLHQILTMPALKRRRLLREYGVPRHLYKYRAIPHNEDSKVELEQRERFEQVLLRNQLFLARSLDFNDPFDSQADYRVPWRGAELRKRIERYLRSSSKRGSAQIRGLVSGDIIAHPEAIEAQSKANHQRILKNMGICCLSADPANPLMWAHYAQEHRGVCFQFRVAEDAAALNPHHVEYSEHYPVRTDMFELADHRNDLLPFLRKSLDWEYEQEWRLLRPEEAHQPIHVRPQAITGVILGMRILPEDRDYILSLVARRDERFRTRTSVFTGEPAPGEYRVRMRRLRN